MKAITIHQPWAGLIAIGEKHFETRSWPTKYRGPIAIHAGKKDPHHTMQKLPGEVQREIYRAYYDHFNIISGAINWMPTGVVVAMAELVECYEVHIDHTGNAVLMRDGVPKIWMGKDSIEFHFGFYGHGRFAWELADVKMLPEPIPAKGQQGIWNWEDNI